jgi:hypothetical protein
VSIVNEQEAIAKYEKMERTLVEIRDMTEYGLPGSVYADIHNLCIEVVGKKQ